MKGRCFANPTPMRSGMPASMRGKRGAHGAIQDPDLGEARAPHQRDEPHEIDAAPQLRAAMLEIDHLGDAGLGLQQLLRVRCGRREKRDGASRLRRGDRAHVRQVPDDVADALLHLNDGGRRHGAAFLQTTRLVPRMCRSPSWLLGLDLLERARHALPHAVVMPEHDAVRRDQRPRGFAIGDDILVGVRAIDEHEAGAAMMRREVERRRIPVSLRDAPRIGRPFGLRLGEVAPRPGLVDEGALARREREFRCRLRREDRV